MRKAQLQWEFIIPAIILTFLLLILLGAHFGWLEKGKSAIANIFSAFRFG